MSNGPYQNSSSVIVALNNGVKYLIQAFTNAALSQCVQIIPPSGATAQFDGTGENNVPMGLTKAGFLTAGSIGSWPSFTVPGSLGGTSKYTFTASNSGNGTGGIEANWGGFGLLSNWQFTVNYISYEDTPTGKSPDYNDSFVILTSWTPPLT
jgi:hypothetical protein